MNSAESDNVMRMCVSMTNHVNSRAREFRTPSHKTHYRMLHLRHKPKLSQNRHKYEGYIVPVQPSKHIVGEEILLYSFIASALDGALRSASCIGALCA